MSHIMYIICIYTYMCVKFLHKMNFLSSTSLITDFRPFANVMPFSSFLENEAEALHYFVGCSQILLVSGVIVKFCVNLSSLGVVKFVYLVADGDTCKNYPLCVFCYPHASCWSRPACRCFVYTPAIYRRQYARSVLSFVQHST